MRLWLARRPAGRCPPHTAGVPWPRITTPLQSAVTRTIAPSSAQPTRSCFDPRLTLASPADQRDSPLRRRLPRAGLLAFPRPAATPSSGVEYGQRTSGYTQGIAWQAGGVRVDLRMGLGGPVGWCGVGRDGAPGGSRAGSCRPGRAAQGPSPRQPRPRTTGREPMRLSEREVRAGPGYGARWCSFRKLRQVGRGDLPCCTGEGTVTARARRRPGEDCWEVFGGPCPCGGGAANLRRPGRPTGPRAGVGIRRVLGNPVMDALAVHRDSSAAQDIVSAEGLRPRWRRVRAGRHRTNWDARVVSRIGECLPRKRVP
jgi:hypothetical protein